jgi:adenylate kinase
MIVIFIGAPGAGKGTQADLLVRRCGFVSLSTGDALRKHVREGTAVGKLAKQVMDRGELVSDEILLSILQEELAELKDRKVILDGYPRNIKQAETLGTSFHGHEVAFAVHFDVEADELLRRLGGRLVCKSCGATYHAVTQAPKNKGICDRCGGQVYQRADDSEDSIRKRLEVYRDSTTPVLDYYQSSGRYRRVAAQGEMESIFRLVQKALDIPS